MVHASLFSGIGGFDLAAHWMGWTNLFQVERDPWCLAWLEQKFPNAERYKDIRTFNKAHTAKHANRVDVLTGGFPCQPYSNAGQRRGKADDRHLWPEMLRVIAEVRPRYVVGENVRGLTTWGDGVVVDEVLADLEGEGYRPFPPLIIPACGQNAPHRRDRVWFVAYCDGAVGSGDHGREHEEARGEVRRHEAGDVSEQRGRIGEATGAGGVGGRGRGAGDNGGPRSDREVSANAASIAKREQGDEADAVSDSGHARGEFGGHGGRRYASDAQGVGIQRRGPDRIELAQGAPEAGLLGRDFSATYWTEFPTVSPVRARNDGVPGGLVRHTDGTGSRYNEAQVENRIRKAAIKAAGNAIVPHMAVALFTAIEYVEAQRRIATGTT